MGVWRQRRVEARRGEERRGGEAKKGGGEERRGGRRTGSVMLKLAIRTEGTAHLSSSPPSRTWSFVLYSFLLFSFLLFFLLYVAIFPFFLSSFFLSFVKKFLSFFLSFPLSFELLDFTYICLLYLLLMACYSLIYFDIYFNSKLIRYFT